MGIWKAFESITAGGKRTLWFGIGLGVFYWIIQSAAEAFIFHEGSLTSRIFTPGMHEIWMRSLTIGIIVLAPYVGFVIAKRKQAEERVRESEERYKSVVENIGIGISVISPDMEILAVNSQVKKWFPDIDVSKKPVCYKVFNYPPRKDICSYCPTCKTLTDGQTHESITDTPVRDEIRNYRIISSPIKNAEGKVTAAIEMVEDITERKQGEDEIKKINALLEAINRTQSLFIVDTKPEVIFNSILDSFLSLTNSKYGFIGEILFTAEEKPYLKTHAITNIAWNEETKALYEKYAPNMGFYNLKTLFGEVMITCKPVISNNPSTDPRRGGLPEGHPPLDCFLGIPFSYGNNMIGMVGVANRPGGYNEETIEYLQPLLNTCGNIVEAYRNIQKRKQAELATMESENRYSMVVENIDEIIYKVSFKEDPLEGVVEFVSGQTEKIIGYQRNDFLIAPDLWFKIIHIDDRSSVAQATHEMVKNKKAVTRYYRLRHKITSEYLWMEDKVAPMIDDNNNVIGCFGVARDITERKKIEEDTSHTVSLLRATLESTTDGILVVDKEGKIESFNQKFVEMWHIPESVIESQNDNQALAFVLEQLKDPEGFLKKVRELYALPAAESFDRIEFKDGRIFERYSKPQRIGETNVGRVWSFRDITERKKMEEKIFQTQHDWEDTFDIITDMITVHDKDLNIIRYNKAAEKILGLPFLNVTKDKCFQFYHGTEFPPVGCPICQTFKTGVLSTVEIFEPHLNMFIEIRAIPRFDSEHQIIGLIHVARDISGHKKLEDQLRHAQKMEAIGTLTGGIAHDFNNILTAIIGYASILRMKMNKDDPLRVNLDQILASSERAANLIQSLLAFSRKQISHLEPINICDNIKNIEKLLMRVISESITLKTILTGDLTVMADSTQMDQVLINLCTNARDAMPDGGTLIIKTEPVELGREFIASHGYGEHGKYALISVTDTGIGMDKKTRERIFEPFFTTKEVGKGTGLGLAIVYGIIKQHKGFITCYSEPDKGTTFKIYLPIIKSELREIKEIKIPDLTIATETVLLAEDEVEIRGLTRQILEGAGYKVIEAVDGEDAVNKFIKTEDKIDLLLFDVIMPKMNGKEAYDRIKKIKPDVKILLTSGYPADFINKGEIYEPGINFVSKPVSPTALLKKVREVLNS